MKPNTNLLIGIGTMVVVSAVIAGVILLAINRQWAKEDRQDAREQSHRDSVKKREVENQLATQAATRRTVIGFNPTPVMA